MGNLTKIYGNDVAETLKELQFILEGDYPTGKD